jgi:saccharopine dehydrogenase-like NADP-dependent oxidoreductase
VSRVVHLKLDQGVVVIRCLSEQVGVSAIETLPSGGVRLVTTSNDGADRIRKKLRAYLIKDEVVRERHRPASASPYATAIQNRANRSPNTKQPKDG